MLNLSFMLSSINRPIMPPPGPHIHTRTPDAYHIYTCRWRVPKSFNLTQPLRRREKWRRRPSKKSMPRSGRLSRRGRRCPRSKERLTPCSLRQVLLYVVCRSSVADYFSVELCCCCLEIGELGCLTPEIHPLHGAGQTYRRYGYRMKRKHATLCRTRCF